MLTARERVKGALGLRELEKDGDEIIKGLALFLKGSPAEMEVWLKKSFDLSSCFLGDGVTKGITSKCGWGAAISTELLPGWLPVVQEGFREVPKGSFPVWKRYHGAVGQPKRPAT